MSAPTLFLAPGEPVDETPRCICGAAAPDGFCPDFPSCLPQPVTPRFEDETTELYAEIHAVHARVMRTQAHGGHNVRARARMLRALADGMAAARDAGVRR